MVFSLKKDNVVMTEDAELAISLQYIKFLGSHEMTVNGLN